MTITADSSALYKIRHCLPTSVTNSLTRLDKSALDKISEIRLRRNGAATVTIDGKNAVLTNSGATRQSTFPIKTTKEEIDDFVYKFCKGSIYSFQDSLSEFYITNDGIRVGLSGNAVYKDQKLISIGDISGICIRLPHHIEGCSNELYDFVKENGFPDGKGILISSSPGIGKTTILRDFAVKLSDVTKEDFRRVCIIDERNEIYMDKIFDSCCAEFLSGVGKIKGMEIACRVLAPQIIICDEISGPDEAEKITKCKNTGFVFIASVHSENAHDALAKEHIQKMFKEGVFSHIYSLNRIGSKVTGTLTEFNHA